MQLIDAVGYEYWTITELKRISERASYRDLSEIEIDDIERWSVRLPDSARARMLAALVTADTPADMVKNCAGAVSRCADWQGIAGDMLARTEINNNTAWFFAQVLRTCLPDHLLARQAGKPAFAFVVNDAIKAGERITFSPSLTVTGAHNCIVANLANPYGDCSVMTLDFRDDGVVMYAGETPWLSQASLACDAFLVVAAATSEC